MDMDTTNTRFTVIERDWKTSSAETRAGLRDELETMKVSLADATGSDAAAARWLSRRIDRVVRYLDTELI